MSLTVYTYSNCDTCRRAVKWLRARDISFEKKPIRETPPSVQELRAMLAVLGGERRRLFNTAGRDYRDLKIGDKLDAMSTDEAFALLASNGNLVKRPFALWTSGGSTTGVVGFDEAAWAAAFGP